MQHSRLLLHVYLLPVIDNNDFSHFNNKICSRGTTHCKKMSVSTSHWRRQAPNEYLFPSGNGCLLIDCSGNTRWSSGQQSERSLGAEIIWTCSNGHSRAALNHRYGPTRYNWLYRKILYGSYWCVHAPRNDQFPGVNCLFVSTRP